MTLQVQRCKKWVVAVVLLGATSRVSIPQSPSFAAKTPEEAARNHIRNEQLRRYSSVRTYEIRNTQGKLAAQTVVHVDYEAPDKKTFNKTSEKGSGIVRHLVFDRLIQSEGETSSGREHHDSAMKIAGHPAKKPSFWVNRADFVREYQKLDGFWLPFRDETLVDVKMYGRKVFTVDHQQYVVNPANPVQEETRDVGDPEQRFR